MAVNNPGATPPQRDLAEATRDLADRLMQQDETLRQLTERLEQVTNEFNELSFLLGQHQRQEQTQLWDPSTMHGPSIPMTAFASAQESGAAYSRIQTLQRSMAQYQQSAQQRAQELQREAERAVMGSVATPAPAPAAPPGAPPPSAAARVGPQAAALTQTEANRILERAAHLARAAERRDQLQAAEAKREQALQEKDEQMAQRQVLRERQLGIRFERGVERDERQQQAANVAAAVGEHAYQMAYLPTVGSRQHYARAYAQQQQERQRLTQADVQRARIHADYAQSPQGQESYRQQLDTQRQIEEHRAREERSKQIAEMGRFRFALSEARDRLVTFGSASAKVGAGLIAMAGIASPNSAATMAGSFQLLMMQAGRPFVPMMERASGVMQDFYRFNKDFAESTGYSPATGLAAAALGHHFGGWKGAAAAAAATLAMTEGEGPGAATTRIGGQALTGAAIGSMLLPGLGTVAGAGFGLMSGGITELVRGSEGPEDEKKRLRGELLRSYAGLPQGGQYSSYEGYMMQAQAAYLSQSPLDRQIMQDQLEVIEKILNRLEALGDHGAPQPGWR